MKFYILSEEAFTEVFPEASAEISSYFFWDQHLGYGGLAGDSFNLDHFLDNSNVDRFSMIVAALLDSYSMSKEEIRAKVIASEKLKEFERIKVARFLAVNIDFDEAFGVKEHFEILQRALQKRTFYELSHTPIEDLEGEWTSTYETGALDYNYNMTDFMALGKQVKLVISKHDQRFYISTWLVKVYDYTTREERDLAVRQTYVTFRNGYLHHHYDTEGGFYFSHRSPVFDYKVETFQTQFGDVGFTFRRT